MTLKVNSIRYKNKLLKIIAEKTALIPKDATDLKTSNLSRIGSSVNRVYSFSLHYKSRNQVNLQLVIKLFRSTESHRILCQKTYLLMKYLQGSNFLVPEVFAMEINDNSLGGPFIIMEKIDGQNMSEYVRHHKKKDVHSVIKRFAESCLNLHELSFDGITDIFHISKDEYFYARKSAFLKDELSYARNWDYTWVTDWLKISAEKCPCNKYSILHVDMSLKNFIVTKNKKIIFVDWEWAEVGDALRDVSCAYHEIRHVIGKNAASFFINYYIDNSKRSIDRFKLRFYLATSALNLALYFRFLGTKSLGTKTYLSNIFGSKATFIAPFLRWHFNRRRIHLENYIRSEVLDYEKLMFNTSGGKLLSQMEKKDIIDLAAIDSSDLVLDVGTGSGRIAREIISKKGARVIGIDLGFQLTSLSKKKRITSGNYELIVADCQYLPFKKNIFDVIVCIRAIKYFPNYVLGLLEMKRALNCSGRLILDFSSIFGYEIVLRYITHSIGARGHRVFNIYKMKKLLEENGLVAVKSLSLQKIPHPIWNLFGNLTVLNFLLISERVLKIITPQFLSRSILVKCVKISQPNRKRMLVET